MTSPSGASASPSGRVHEIADAYVTDMAALDPVAATMSGIPGYDDRLPDLSPDGFRAREQTILDAFAAMETASAHDHRARAAKAAFLERLGVTRDQLSSGYGPSELNVIATAAHYLREVFDLMDTSGEESWVNIDSRLAGIPAALQQFRQTLDAAAAGGDVSAHRQIAALAGQIRSWTGAEGDVGDFFRTFVDGHHRPRQLPAALAASLAEHARGASAAYAAFGRYLDEDLGPRGRTADAVGRERYQIQSRYFLGATVDLDETYEWGWEELARLVQEMGQVASAITPGGTLEDAVEALDTDPARRIVGRAAFRGWMQDLADRTIDGLAGVHFDIPEPVRTIECCLAPTNDGGIYYTGPSEDFSRPGRMWWALPDGVEDFWPWQEVSTVFHEGVPGHHLQVAQTAYRSGLLNRWQRTMCWTSGHGEGWALYAERLMDELGYLHDPGDKLGMLDSQAMRAVRVVIDIGMHLQLRIPTDNPLRFHPGETWTPALGLEFLRRYTRLSDPVSAFELERYLGWPGQAPSYKIGERIWLQARADARRAKGAGFDLKEFHRAALDLGGMGLETLRQELALL